MALTRLDFRKVAKEAAFAASEKKAVDILILDVRKDSDSADYMLLAGAESTPQLRAIYEGVVAHLQDIGVRPLRQDGHSTDRWVAIDYGGLLVHILTREAREFYRLEHMWEHPHMVAWDDGMKEKGKRKKGAKERRHPGRP